MYYLNIFAVCLKPDYPCTFLFLYTFKETEGGCVIRFLILIMSDIIF